MRVRDLEIALVLAREMKAAAARSVDASLRLDQLQEVFGVEELDGAERARIQTALQMAGLEPFPSLLEADPAEPIRFGAAKAVAPAGAGTAASPPDEPPAAEPPAEAPPTFPTVGEFARSKFGRSRRARRGDHGADHTPPPEPPADEELEGADEYVEANGYLAEEIEEQEQEPEPEVTQVHDVPDEPELAAEPELEDEPELQDEPEAVHEPEPADEREYIPLVSPEELEQPEPVAYPEPAAPEPTGARSDELMAALLPAVAIPVIVTSIAGWKFGLPFVALSVIATGFLLGRRSAGSARRGVFAILRQSPAAATVLKTTAVVTVLSIVASVVLASAGKDSSQGTKKTATPAKPPAAAKPTSAAKPAATPTKPKATKKKTKPSKPATAKNGPVPDPSTQGLVRVPPKSATPTQGSGPNGTGTTTTTQPGTTAPPPQQQTP